MALILSRAEVEQLLTMKDAIEVLEEAFKEMAKGSVAMPLRPTIRIQEPSGIVNIMPAYLAEMGALGLKLVSSYIENPRLFSLPTIQATILYADYRNGKLLAVMEGAYITAIRTGAASGVATKYLAREDSSLVGLIGSGVQAETQLEAVCAVRPIEEAKVYSPNRGHREAFASRMSERLGIEVRAVESAREAIEGCDIAITATSSKEPVLKGTWLREGVHINGIGSHTPDARELDEEAVIRSKVFVDSREAALKEAGDLIIPMKLGIIGEDHIKGELGEVILGKREGRKGSDEITLFKSQGLAIEDISTAKLVYERAKEKGLGREVEL